jgi:hypothetical protein
MKRIAQQAGEVNWCHARCGVRRDGGRLRSGRLLARRDEHAGEHQHEADQVK